MARFFKYICMLIVLLILSTACQNEGDIGDFYGQWALKKSCVNEEVKEHDNLYFSFQGKVVWAKRANAVGHTYSDVFGGFIHQGDSLFMYFIQQNEVTSPKALIEKEFGFADCENVRVQIRTLNASELFLVSGDNYWQFKKH